MTSASSRTFVVLVAFVMCLTCLDACSDQYSAAAISAHVVDAETGQPLAGVNVVAHWQLEGGWEGGMRLGAVKAMETVTGSDGHFSFPAWGPVEVPRPRDIDYMNARVKSMAPQLLFFKAGYAYKALQNGREDVDPKNMHSQWNEKVIKLPVFRGESQGYADALRELSANLEQSLASPGPGCHSGIRCAAACQWEQVPNMIVSIGEEFARLRGKGIDSTNIYFNLMNDQNFRKKLGCRPPAAILGRELK